MSGLAVLAGRPWVAENVPLGPMTTYKLGGPARWLVTVDDPAVLDEVIATGVFAELPVLVLGRGSNLVVSDRGFDGVVVRLGGGYSRMEFSGHEVGAGAAVPLPRLARTTAERGMAGLEFYVGVPGSVGGAVRQNAGCFGIETRDRLVRAHLVDLRTGRRFTADPDDLDLRYRHSNVAPHHLVEKALFRTEPGDPGESLRLIREITRWRREHQPGGTFNAGSVFKNPEGASAGKIIDELGLKGLSVGGVSVSGKHANFFVAGPDATAADIRALVRLVQEKVLEATGIRLEPEIQFVGFDE
ncbi:MAG: UDP-N-acetylmuramate dehydrogenase [Actinomycetes bacterium]|nr:MAG: UDP-N-acetylenolpyruvoylglucosamine reductase [Actinomycetota bacterium]